MTTPLDTLWYTHSPVPTGLGIAVQTGRLADAQGFFQVRVAGQDEGREAGVAVLGQAFGNVLVVRRQGQG
ncbi:hypothetical protein QV12_00015, partial [Pseudomonas putida]